MGRIAELGGLLYLLLPFFAGRLYGLAGEGLCTASKSYLLDLLGFFYFVVAEQLLVAVGVLF